MKPLSDFTTPRRLIAPMSRHFFPVEQPEPFCCTTGLKNGSRLPLSAHFFSSCLGFAATAPLAGAGGPFTAGLALDMDAAIVVEAILVVAGVVPGALAAPVAGAAILVAGAAWTSCFASGLEVGAAFEAGAFTTVFGAAATDFPAYRGCG